MIKGLLLCLLLLFLVGCATQPVVVEETPSMEKKEAAAVEPTDVSASSETHSGNVLAGTTTPYIEFNTADYEKAQADGKTIVLYFYANWCPICRAEQPETFAAFNELNREDVVGFRVNYNDNDTDDDEEALAKEFGVTYQHTKVIVKDGTQVLKSLTSWKKQQYLDEINKL